MSINILYNTKKLRSFNILEMILSCIYCSWYRDTRQFWPGWPHINSAKPNQTLSSLKLHSSVTLFSPLACTSPLHERRVMHTAFWVTGGGVFCMHTHTHALTSVAACLIPSASWPTLTSLLCTHSQIALRNKAVSYKTQIKNSPFPLILHTSDTTEI